MLKEESDVHLRQTEYTSILSKTNKDLFHSSLFINRVLMFKFFFKIIHLMYVTPKQF